MAELKRISVEEFVELAERHERAYKYARVFVYCEVCLLRPKPPIMEVNDCPHCGGKGTAVVTLPILIVQKMTPEDFEFLRMAVRLGDQYG